MITEKDSIVKLIIGSHICKNVDGHRLGYGKDCCLKTDLRAKFNISFFSF